MAASERISRGFKCNGEHRMTVINGVSLDKTGEKQGRWKPGQSGNPNRDNLYGRPGSRGYLRSWKEFCVVTSVPWRLKQPDD
jgi:hypothetical protein